MKLISFGVERRGTCRAKTKTQQKTMKMNSFESDRGIKNVKKNATHVLQFWRCMARQKGAFYSKNLPACLAERWTQKSNDTGSEILEEF